jgi:putative selenium metabolism hydrolase
MGSVTPDKLKKIAEEKSEHSVSLLSRMVKTPSLSGDEERIVSLLSRMVKTPSLSGDEERMARLLEKEFREGGADEVIVDGFGNVIARLGSRGPVIAFDGHLDTVDIGQRSLWDRDPHSGEVKDGRIHGRGSVDQKGGLAAMAAAIRIIKETSSDLPFTLFFVGSTQEEICEGLSWQYIVNEDEIVPDMVILTEPTGGQICRGHRGRMEMEITVEGVSCHGSTPELGSNAIYKTLPIISIIERIGKDLPTDPFLGRGSIAVTRIRSNSPSLNAIPDMTAIYLDRRLTAGEDPEDARLQIESLPEVQAADARIVIPVYEEPSWRGTTYPTLKTYRAWSLDERHHLIEYAGRCYNQLFNTNPEIGKWPFSTNGVVTKGVFDIPTFGFGPGDGKMAHAPNESVAVDDIIRCAAFYAYFPWIVVGR